MLLEVITNVLFPLVPEIEFSWYNPSIIASASIVSALCGLSWERKSGRSVEDLLQALHEITAIEKVRKRPPYPFHPAISGIAVKKTTTDLTGAQHMSSSRISVPLSCRMIARSREFRYEEHGYK